MKHENTGVGGSYPVRMLILTFLILSALGTTARSQDQTFNRDGLDYALDLPGSWWRAVLRVDVHEHYEFINGNDPSEGFLRLRKKVVAPATEAKDIFRDDEKWELRRLPGYVVCSTGEGTNFKGHLPGTVFSYEYVNRGRNMDGRIYYLQVDNRTFYALHFTVASEKLNNLREQMDKIARSFRLK